MQGGKAVCDLIRDSVGKILILRGPEVLEGKDHKHFVFGKKKLFPTFEKKNHQQSGYDDDNRNRKINPAPLDRDRDLLRGGGFSFGHLDFC